MNTRFSSRIQGKKYNRVKVGCEGGGGGHIVIFRGKVKIDNGNIWGGGLLKEMKHKNCKILISTLFSSTLYI